MIHRTASEHVEEPATNAHELLTTMLHRVAPDVDLDAVDRDELLQDAADLDSMDFLNLLAVLHDLTGVDIPEHDYPQLTTVACVERYLEEHVPVRRSE